jgi:hypothetical protein
MSEHWQWHVYRKGEWLARVPRSVAPDKLSAMKLAARYAMKRFVPAWFTAVKFKHAKR